MSAFVARRRPTIRKSPAFWPSSESTRSASMRRASCAPPPLCTRRSRQRQLARSQRSRRIRVGTIVTLTMNPALDIATSTDRVIPTHKLRCSPPRYDPGGGGINVARAVHALGGNAVAIFPIGGFTRESLAVEDRQSGEQFRFILPGPEVSEADQERCLDQLSAVAAQADFIVASGSLPLGVREDFYARLAQLAQMRGRRLVLDTSGAALKQAGRGIYLLKASLRELQDLVGREIGAPLEQEKAAREVIEQGRSEIIVLSLGAEGALLVTARQCERFAAVPVEARSTVGAGDSMLAGIVLGLSRGLPLREAVRFGLAAGAAALLGSGTELCRRSDVEHLYHPK